MTRPLNKLVAALAFCVSALSMMGTAQAAGFSVRLDCHGTNGLPSWAATSDVITVSARINGFYNVLGSVVPGANWCDGEDEISFSLAAFSAADVDMVRVTTTGSNSFWMDQVTLRDSTSGAEYHWGVDNNVGYCVSRTASDGNNSYCFDAVAKTTYDFNN